MQVYKKITFAAGVVALAACAYQPKKYDAGITLPESFTPEVIHEVTPQVGILWWKNFESDELITLMDELHAANDDIQLANLRIEKSQALMGVQKSANWPQFSGNLSARQDNNHETNQSSNAESLTFQAAYEVDLWGARDANDQSADYRLAFEQQSLNRVLLTQQSLLSQQYFDALALKARIAITQTNLESSQTLFKQMQLKFTLGHSSTIELQQQNNILLMQKQQLKFFARDYTIAKRSIAILLGRDDLDSLKLTGDIHQVTLPTVALTQPAKLLENRPDIRMAELNLSISDAELFAAKAKRWPSLTLSAEASLQNVLDGGNLTTSLLGNFLVPVFQGGRIQNTIKAAEVETSIQLTNYRKTVINALKETLNTLTALDYQKEVYRLQRDTVANNQNLYDQAKLEYEVGAKDFLNLVSAQRSLFEARDAEVQQKFISLNTLINLYKALGNAPNKNVI